MASWKEVALIDDLAAFAQTDATSLGVAFGHVSNGSLDYATGTSAQFLVLNGSNSPVFASMSGDISITDAGVASIGAAVIVEGDLADNAVTFAKMNDGVAGDIIVYNASNEPIALAHGTAGQALVVGADVDGNVPKWSSAAEAGTLTVNEEDTETTNYICFTASSAGTSTVKRDTDFYYDAADNKLTVPKITSTLTGTADVANAIKQTASVVNTTYYVPFTNASGGDSSADLYGSTILTIDTNASTGVSDFKVAGNLVVEGVTTTVNTSELLVEDKTISVASGATTMAGGASSGLVVNGGGGEGMEPRLFWENTGGASGSTDTTLGWTIADHGAISADVADGVIGAPYIASTAYNIAPMLINQSGPPSTLSVGRGSMYLTAAGTAGIDSKLYIQVD